MDSLRGAELSKCARYRYKLWRGDVTTSPLAFLCLNPSTADHQVDDPTVRRLRGFTAAYGFSGFVLVNLFAYRATEPKELLSAPDAVGPDNDATLQAVLRGATVIGAWGSQAGKVGRMVHDRLYALSDLLENIEIWSLGEVTKDGSPRHPLYLRSDVELEPWSPSMLR